MCFIGASIVVVFVEDVKNDHAATFYEHNQLILAGVFGLRSHTPLSGSTFLALDFQDYALHVVKAK